MNSHLRAPRRSFFLTLAAAALLATLLAAAQVQAQTATPTPAASPADGALLEAQRLSDGGESEAAVTAFRQAIDLYRAARNADGEVGARFFLALHLRKLDRCADALPEYQAALEAARPLNNAILNGSLWLGIGDCRALVGEREDALSAYDEAARLFLASKDDAARRFAVSALNSAGVTLNALARHAEAAAKFEAALPIAVSLKDQRAELMLQAGLGTARKASNRHEEALAAYARARELAEALGDSMWQQLALEGTGGVRAALRQHQAALADFEAAAAIAQERGDVAGEALARMDAGLALYDLGRYGEALEQLQAALALEQAAGNRTREALALRQVGAALEALGRNREALARYEAARAIAGEIKDAEQLARLNNDMGLLYDLLGRSGDAESALQAALQLAKELGAPKLEGTVRNNQGAVSNHRGRYDEAAAFYDEALALFRQAGSAADEAVTLNNQAQNYDSQGRYAEARPLYEQALAIHRRLDDTVGEAAVIENMAGQDVAQGRYREALERYQAALGVFRDRGLLQQQAVGLNNLATLYMTLGRPDEAQKSYREALDIRRQIGDRAGEGILLGQLAALDYERSDYEAALAGYRAAAAIAAEVSDPGAAATWQNHVATVLSEMGRNEEARAVYRAALEAFRALGDQAGEASALNGLGLAQAALSTPDDGLDYLDQAYALYRELGEVAGQATALSNKAFLLEALHREAEALEAYRQSLALREQLRGAAPGEDLRVGLTQNTAAVYDAAATLAMKLGRGEEAFAFTERARGRQLLDQLSAGRLDLAAGADGALLEREQALRAEISRLDQDVREERVKPSAQRSGERVQALSQELATRQAEYDALVTEIKSRNPQYAAMVSAEPAALAEIQALLPPDVTLVSYYIGTDASFAFIIQATGFHTVTLQAPASEVWEQVAGFRHSFADLNNPFPSSLGWLSNRLIAPVAPYLTTPVVGIAPHGPLHYLPFAALDWTGAEPAASKGVQKPGPPAPLGTRFTLFSLPSVSALPYLPLEAAAPEDDDALVLSYASPAGLAPLQEADAEAQAVATALGSEPLTGAAASETALRQRAPGSGVVHIAAHGQLNHRAPLFSRLLLAPDGENDGSLEVHEVYGLDLKNADLVTLSACQTDMGKLSVGDDVTGLSRAFFYAGARSVVASLWSVDDAATAALMQAFYQNLSAGMGKAQALRAAQASVRDDPAHPEWRHPYYWAAFVLSGDPGVSVEPRQGINAVLSSAPWVSWAAAALAAALVALALVALGLGGIRRLRARRRVL